MVLSAYYQPNRPHWDVPHICSVLHSHCSLSLTHSLRSMLTPTIIAIYNLAFPVLPFIVHSFTLALIFTHLSPFSTPCPPLPSPRLFDFVAVAQWTLLPLSLPPRLILISLCFIALTTSLLYSSLPPSPSRWSIFCLLCLRRLFSPHRLLSETHEGS